MDFELLGNLDVAACRMEVLQDTFGLIVDALGAEGFSRRTEEINEGLAVNFAAGRFPTYMSALCLLSGELYEMSVELNRIRDAMHAAKAT